MTFEPLFSKSSSGKIRVWKISTNNDEIITEYGYVDGKMAIARKIVAGKNIGKANETRPKEQAIKDAQSAWNKKIDQGYKPMTNDNAPFQKCEVILPMLALPFKTRSHDIKYPCYVQPKIDGVRALFYNGKLWSRNGKEFVHLDHIISEISNNNLAKIKLDGEMYSDQMSFQELVGLTRKVTLHPGDETELLKIKYIIYDHIDDKDFKDRHTLLINKIHPTLKYVKILKTETINDIDDVYSKLHEYINEGHEGIIVRNVMGPYVLKYRSKNLQKLKLFDDAEFLIIDYTEGVGIETGLIIFTCETDKKFTFNVRPKGTHECRAKMFKTGAKYIGKYLTVRYQGVSDDGIPRFPIGIEVRNYE
jgi:DNA ligase-1